MRNHIVLFVSSLFWSYGFSQSPCRTPLGLSSICVSLYDCPQLISAFTSRPVQPDMVTFLRQSQCGFEGRVPRVCCGDLPQQNKQNNHHPKSIDLSDSQACTTPLGVRSNCVSLYDCQQLLAAFEQRPLEPRVVSFLRQSQCGFVEYTPRVCCGPLPRYDAVQTTPAPSQPFTNNIDPSQVDPPSEEDSRLASRNTCGVDTNGDRIYGGQFTDLDEFPWMALMGYRTRSGSMTYQCGGVLVNKRYVLTAAHCIVGAIETKIGKLTTARLGEYDIQNAVDCVDSTCADPPQEIPVQMAIAHPGYSDKNKNRYDDIGIARLSRRVNYSYYVQPICLVSTNERLDVGSDVYVAGWGKTLTGKSSPIKLKLGMPIFDKSECNSKYQTLGATIGDKQLCAGGVFNKDSCTGDSGGPLMRKRPEGVWETVAVVSFGHGCGRDGWPGVYTSVAHYIDWIQNTLRSTNV